MKNLVLLGASGSIGQSTMDIISDHRDEFVLKAISVGKNISKLEEYLREFTIEHICVLRKEDYLILRDKHPNSKWYYGDKGLMTIATLDNVDLVINALVGFVGLLPTMSAINLGRDVALANKETLVVAGELIMKACKANNVKLLPIDSEHSAIFQCLQGQENKINKLIITASGGSFRNKTRSELDDVTIAMALNHPNWNMGAKITIDSATMMNKGFEVIEAHYLFDVDYDNIEVLLHRNSIIHSMVEFSDHSVLAQLGTPDMRIPIQYALSYPNRIEMKRDNALDLVSVSGLTFERMDFIRYPLLKLAYEVGRKKGILPCVMNAANEVAVARFINNEISFLDIERIIFKCVEECVNEDVFSIEQLLLIDNNTRIKARSI